MALVGERGERARLRDAVDAEVVADPVERGDHLGLADGVSDAQARHAVRLRERAEAQHARVGGSIAGSDPAGAKSAYASSRQSSTSRDSAPANASTAAASHQLPIGLSGLARNSSRGRSVRGQREQRVEILAVVAVGRGDEAAAVADDVERERRIRAERRDDGDARLDVQAGDDAEQRVDALADDHVRRA